MAIETIKPQSGSLYSYIKLDFAVIITDLRTNDSLLVERNWRLFLNI